MQRDLVQIGIDRLAAYAVGSPTNWVSDTAPVSSYRRVTHVGLAEALGQDPRLPMLDLRRNSEWDDDFPSAARADLTITAPEHGHRLGTTYAD